MKQKIELPEKYQNCDWLFIYGNIGLTNEHIKRLNNAINLLGSLNEHTDAKYLEEIKDKLLADAPLRGDVMLDTIKKVTEWVDKNYVIIGRNWTKLYEDLGLMKK